jgi:5-methylcytosine-specific restriction endonuclease McrA
MSGWSGRRVTAARKRMAELLPTPCATCGRIVTADMAWDIGHTVPRDVAPDLMWDAAGWRIEHSHCNRAAGARYRNRKQKARRLKPTSRDW